jgi:hypothetical protein
MNAMSLRESLQDEPTEELLRRIRRGTAGTPPTGMTQDDAARFWWLDAGVSDEVAARLIRVAPVPRGGAPRATER